MTEIRNWTVRRSGATMSITGIDADGMERTWSRIVSIESDAPFPIATNEDGEQFRLVTVD
jgi:hypothetical protein